jgi:hypothetical protein
MYAWNYSTANIQYNLRKQGEEEMVKKVVLPRLMYWLYAELN